jgi:hypothetical protein
MSNNQNLNRIIAELRAERNRLRAAEAQGGAGPVSVANLNRQIAELERARNGATVSTATTPVRSRKRSRPARTGPSPNPRTPSNNRVLQRQEAQKRLRNAEEETTRLISEVKRLRANAARTRRRVRSEGNKSVQKALTKQARNINAKANRLNRERQRLENSVNNLFTRVTSFLHLYPPSGKRLKTPTPPPMSPAGIKFQQRLQSALKKITPTRPSAGILRRRILLLAPPPGPRRAPPRLPSPVASKNANTNNNEGGGNKNNNKN